MPPDVPPDVEPVDDPAPPPARVRRRRPAARFLARKPRRLDATMYPDPPAVVERVAAAVLLVDEPECVGPAIADEQGEHAQFLHRQRRMAALADLYLIRAGLTPEQRLADCVRRARRQHVNVSTEQHRIEHEVLQARARGRAIRASVVRQLEQLEARLDELVDPWPGK